MPDNEEMVAECSHSYPRVFRYRRPDSKPPIVKNVRPISQGFLMEVGECTPLTDKRGERAVEVCRFDEGYDVPNDVNNPDYKGRGFFVIPSDYRNTPCNLTPTRSRARPSQAVARDEAGRFTRPDAHRRRPMCSLSTGFTPDHKGLGSRPAPAIDVR